MSTKDNLPPIPVGVLFSHSGSMAVTEKAHLEGTLLAIGEINANGGVLGRQIEPVVKNPQSQPNQYAVMATQMLSANDQIKVMFGCCSSASRKAVLPIIERFECMLFYPSFYEGFEYSPSVIYTGATPNQMVIPLIQHLFDNYGKRVFLVGSDYIYPREINRIVNEFLQESGGKLVGEEYVPLGSGETAYRRVVEKIRDGECDAIISTVVGEDTPIFYDCYAAAKIDCPIASLTTSEAELALMDHDARAGHLTASSYFNTMQTEQSVEFATQFRQKYGKDSQPSVYSQTAYFQVYLFAKALELCGDSDDFQSLIEVLRDLRIDTPQGEVWIDEETNHVYLTPRIGKSSADGTFEIVWERSGLVKPDPYLVGYNRTILSKLSTKKIIL